MDINQNSQVKIPRYVTDWTDKYFHQSAFDTPLRQASEGIVNFLSNHFKKDNKIKLFRGVNCFNENNVGITSWTYDRKVAERYAEETKGKVTVKEFEPASVLLDTTTLNPEQKMLLGYDYKVDDKEVLVLSKN